MPYRPRSTGANPYGPSVTFATEDVLPPSAFYLSMNDTPICQMICSSPGLVFQASLRMLLPDGTIQVDNYQSTTPFSPQTYFIVIPPVEGYLLSCLVELFAGLTDGSCWCTFAVFKGYASVPVISFPPTAGMVLVQGYIDEFSYLAWPNSPNEDSGDGAGRVYGIPITVAPGTNLLLRTTASQRWQVISLVFRFTTSAAVPARQVSIILLDRFFNGLGRFPCTFTQAANLSYAYTFSPGAAHIQTNATWITAPIPDALTLDAGMALQTNIVNLAAGDVIDFSFACVREWMGVSHS